WPKPPKTRASRRSTTSVSWITPIIRWSRPSNDYRTTTSLRRSPDSGPEPSLTTAANREDMYDDDDLAAIRDGKDRWEDETRDPTLSRHGERQDRFATVSNHEVDRLYTPDDVADIDRKSD